MIKDGRLNEILNSAKYSKSNGTENRNQSLYKTVLLDNFDDSDQVFENYHGLSDEYPLG